MAPASTSSGLPIMRWVMRPETKVSTTSSSSEKMIEMRSSVFSIDSTGPSVHFMTSVAFQGPCRSTSSSMGCSCASPALLLGEPERLAGERREAGDLRAVAARRDDAARGGVGLAVDVEIEAHDARVAVQVAEQLLLEVAVVGVGLDALQILGDVVGQLLGAGLGVLDDPVAGQGHAPERGHADRHRDGLTAMSQIFVRMVKPANLTSMSRPDTGRLLAARQPGVYTRAVKTTEPPALPDALLFDLDGTLVDSERENVESVVLAAAPLRRRADRRRARLRDRPLLERDLRHDRAQPRASRSGMHELIAAAVEEKRALVAETGYRAAAGRGRAGRAAGGPVKLAVVSGASRVEVLDALRGIGVLDLFPVVAGRRGLQPRQALARAVRARRLPGWAPTPARSVAIEDATPGHPVGPRRRAAGDRRAGRELRRLRPLARRRRRRHARGGHRRALARLVS